MLLPGGALSDPARQQVDLPVAQLDPSGPGWGHAPGFLSGNALEYFTFGRVSRNDAEVSAKIGLGAGFGIQAQLTFPVGLIGAVAGVAAVRKNRPDIAIELDCRGRCGGERNRNQRADTDDR